MELTEDQTIEIYAKQCGHCLRKTLLPYEFELICISCGYNVMRGKREPTRSQRKETSID